MSFKMRCPKCQGLDYSIERDNRTFGAVAQAFELVFHCRCGKQMFGEQILKEYETQKRDWESNSDHPEEDADSKRERPSHALLKEAAEGREEQRSPVAEVPPVAEPTTSPAKAKAKAEPRKASKAAEAAPQAEAGENQCSWPGCGKIARKNSKYCSRACSNKNARHRHKLRVKTDDASP